jgi:hypothetical protein
MKKILFVLVIVLLMASGVMAQERVYSSGLLTADGAVTQNGGCLAGVLLYPAAADATLVLYDNAVGGTTGTVLFKVNALASTTPAGFPPSVCINVRYGIAADVGGAAAGFIVWYR